MNALPASGVGSRREFVLLVVILGGVSSIGAFATDMYLPALPKVAADLHASPAAIELSVTAFLIGLGLGQFAAGSLSDMFGRRPPLLCGLLIYALTSIACALAPSAAVLTLMRGLQGFSAAFGQSIANAVVTDHFRDRAAARFLSRLALVSLVGPIIAPQIGGALLQVGSWKTIFVVLTCLGLVLLVVAGLRLPESLPRQARVPGSIGATVRIMSRLSRDRLFIGLTLSNACTAMAFYAYLAAASFVVQEVYGATPTVFAVLFSTNAVGLLIASQLNHYLLKWVTPRGMIVAALVTTTVAGMVMLTLVLLGGLGLAAVAVPLFLVVASGCIVHLNTTALALSLHAESAGSASSFFGTTRLVVGAIGTPLVAIGGVSAVTLAAVMAGASLLALIVYAVLVGGRHPSEPEPDEVAELKAVTQIAAG